MSFELDEGIEIVLSGEGLAVAPADVLDGVSELAERMAKLGDVPVDHPRLEMHLGEARANIVLAASALLAAVDTKCTLAAPPEDIRARPGPNKDMILSCFHTPSHCWDGSGKYMDCPP